MLKISREEDNIFVLEIFEPRLATDEKEFILFLDEVFQNSKFGIVLSVTGHKFFSLEGKKTFNMWFKENKDKLKRQCFGFARVSSETSKMLKLTSKALRLAMPCRYEVFNEKKDGVHWLQRNRTK